MLFLCAAAAGRGGCAFFHFRGVNLHAPISAQALRCTAEGGGFFFFSCFGDSTIGIGSEW